MSDIKFNILDYIGKINNGVLTLISITYQDEYYEGTFYYNDNNMLALTVDEELENKIGYKIEELPDYSKLMLSLIKKVVPIEEIITRLDDIDIEKYQSQINSEQEDIVYIDSQYSEQISPTQSES